ncbi:efflux RND transporter permease subunit [Asticcacaulis sp. EMRT-3]|uniref:efflux RND transporter permease subunit n=1 Tax=Asticcacaulis sp. EMRT-3 TaxID=3040349 RepID=UPI0024AFD1FF|nr:efflux RND transporter permease subunit [Asticcacaulis sp. EMRT-3]MDI7776660.1 efflux RND transporter permease subunit [Asticcacaulis sp. EMRT-3]
MLSRFFIDRPIFAWVVAIVIMLAGALSIMRLPVEQYPDIALPQVTVSASYPGASAKTVEDSVTQIIEQSMKGLDGLQYMSATSTATGGASLTLTFKSGTDPDIAQVQVQNKLQTVTALLPQSVQAQGISVVKSTTNFLLVVGVYADDGKTTQADISDYIGSSIKDQISRVDGVGDVQLFGAQYAMRIWLDPQELASYNLMPSDVVAAIQTQNTQVSAGELGGLPAVKGTMLNATITAQSRLTTPEQFRNIIVKTQSNGARVYLSDVARVELGAESYASSATYNGFPASGIAVKLAPGGNALNTAKAVKARMDELSKSFPHGMHYVVPYDTTPFITLSIEEVVKTLVEAVVLVFLVMYVFLQNWRATLIPTIAVPVVLLGTFGVLAAVGYSINTLTLFGLVLAIGLLVDDAIVVIENVERIMSEEGLPPRVATRKSMSEITGALIGIALVLAAVFIPMAFFTGSQGMIYRQFSVTLVSAMALSVLVALILTPALCATLLKPVKKGEGHIQTGLAGWFNHRFDDASNRYQGIVRTILVQPVRWLIGFALIVIAVAVLFTRLPTAFLPEEDQGIIFTLIQLPAGATQERTQKVVDDVRAYFQKDPAVEAVFGVTGFSFGGQGQNMAMAFVRLKDFDKRHAAKDKAAAVAMRGIVHFASYPNASVFAVVPPAISSLGTSSGFTMMLEDQGNVGHDTLIKARNQLLGMAAKDPLLSAVRPTGQEDTAQLDVDVDQAKAGAMNLTLSDVNSVLSTAWGGAYVNDFIDRGRVKKVYVQADAPYRMTAADLDRWYVRNADNQMVPLSSIASEKWSFGAPSLTRYNGQSAVEIDGAPAPGKSSGAAMAEMEKLAKQLPAGIGYEWTGISLQEKQSGNQASALYALSIAVVFLLLAALYESWSIPLAIIMVIPLGVLGALVAMSFRGLNNDVYFQVGLLTIIGLSAKNAILIVEFAKSLHEDGRSLTEATLEAVRIRLRPIIMTSLAFTFGIMPLAISNGAGSGAQHAIGTGLVGGILSATFLAIFFVPLFFVLVQKWFKADEKHVLKLKQMREDAELERTANDGDHPPSAH